MKGTRVLLMLAVAAFALSGMACQQPVSSKLKSIHFDFDQYDVKAEDHTAMKGNAAFLQAASNTSVVVEGHCDERGSTEYNIGLGDRRAKSAKAFLQHLGVSGGRISTVSYGEERPTCNGHDEGCWWKNRRAEFSAR